MLDSRHASEREEALATGVRRLTGRPSSVLNVERLSPSLGAAALDGRAALDGLVGVVCGEALLADVQEVHADVPWGDGLHLLRGQPGRHVRVRALAVRQRVEQHVAPHHRRRLLEVAEVPVPVLVRGAPPPPHGGEAVAVVVVHVHAAGAGARVVEVRVEVPVLVRGPPPPPHGGDGPLRVADVAKLGAPLPLAEAVLTLMPPALARALAPLRGHPPALLPVPPFA
eukprot:CAMPEP_0118923430 /NCGR_PEP_ID=MMETSP1169-20130426/1959_1 /TAXON_ID=36882 /ORGANISM="Pyramimonas obovata, Strain CCMP722" /LENGTH=225 /DNA_ID=CAMNT_0006864411 /DNA_START=140 /DNA_END=814 /DNA_ORIENTATION=+